MRFYILAIVLLFVGCSKETQPNYVEEILYGKSWDLLTPYGELVGTYHFYHDGRIQCLTNPNAPIGHMWFETYGQHFRNAMWWESVYGVGSPTFIYDVCNSLPEPRVICLEVISLPGAIEYKLKLRKP